MSFWSRLDDAYDDATGTFSDGFSSTLHFTNNILSKIPGAEQAGTGAQKALEGMSWAYSNAIARPASTFFQNVQPNSPFSAEYWQGPSLDVQSNVQHNIVEPWKKSGNNAVDTEGNPVEGISPGQALVGSLMGNEFDMDPKSVRERKEFFHNTAAGQIMSGAVDATIGWYADPFVIGAKGIKDFENAGRTTADTNKVAKGFEQIRQGAPKTEHARNTNVTINQLANATPEQIWAHPILKEDPSGALADSIIQVNKEFADDAVKRNDAVRDFLGAAMGDPVSRERLKGKSLNLKNNLDQLQAAPTAARYAEAWSFEDAGAAADDLFTNYANDIHNAKLSDIEAEIGRLDSVSNAYLSRTRGTNKEIIQYNWRNRRLSQTYLPTSKHGRMVRVVGNALSNRLPGHVNIQQAREGWNDVDEYLKQSRWTDNETKRNLLNEFAQATSPNTRTIVAAKIEAQVVADYAHKRGLTREAAEEFYRTGVQGRMNQRATLASKYTEALGADRTTVAMMDPEVDEVVALSTDLARRMGEDHVPMIDPEVLDGVLKKASHQRALEKVVRKRKGNQMRRDGATPERIHAELDLNKPGTKSNDLINYAVDGSKDALRQLVGAWKFTTLLRPAYLPRVQIDSQLRLMTYIGESQAMASILNIVPGFGGPLAPTRSGKELRKAYRSSTKNDRTTWGNVFTDPDYAEALRERFTQPRTHGGETYEPFLNEHLYQQFVDNLAQKSGTGMQDVIGEMSRLKLAESRKAQQFNNITGEDAGWLDAYSKRVNKDILGSPIARQVLLNADHSQAVRAVKSDPKAMAEWNAIKGGDSLDEFVARQRQFIDHYLPEESTARLWATEQVTGRSMAKENVQARQATASAKSSLADAENAVAKAPADLERVRARVNELQAEVITARDEFTRANESYARAQRDITNAKSRRTSAERALAAADFSDKAAVKATRDRLAKARADLKEAQKNAVRPDVNKEAKAKLDKAKARMEAEQKNLKAANLAARTAPDVLETAKAAHASATDNLVRTETGASYSSWDNVLESLSKTEEHKRPLVLSDEFTPYSQNAALKAYNATRKSWFQFAGEAPETMLARSPLWDHAFNGRMNDQIDRAKQLGEPVNLDAFRKNAAEHARKEVGRTLFDVSHASNLSQTMGMVMPFFAAWEDVMKKWWGLMYDKPWIIPRGMMIKDAPNDAGMVYDSEGNLVTASGEHLNPETGQEADEKDKGTGEFITIPGKWVPGSSKGDLRVNKNALNVVFQGEKWYLPGFGPLVQVPTNEYFKRHYPEEADSGIVKFLMPFGVQEEDPLLQTAPGWVRSLHDVMGKTDTFNAQANRLLQIEADRYVNGERDSEPTLDEIMGRTRNWFILKMFLQTTAPVSTQPVPDNRAQFYIDTVRRYQREYGPTAMEKFYEDFPEHFQLTYSITANETGIQASALARKGMVKYKGEVDANPEWGWAILGPANDPKQPWNQGVYTSQLTTDIGPRGNKSRTVKPIADAQEDILRNKGWIEYNQGKMQLDDELAARGLNSRRQKGAEDLKQLWDGYVENQKLENPVWAKDFRSYDTGKVEELVRVINDTANKHPERREQPDVKLLQQYLEGRAELKQILAGREFNSLDHSTNEDIAQQWDGFVKSLTDQNIAFGFMVNRVLSHDTLRGDIVWRDK